MILIECNYSSYTVELTNICILLEYTLFSACFLEQFIAQLFTNFSNFLLYFDLNVKHFPFKK